MSLDVLSRFDSATSGAILAAAALSTAPNPGLDDDAGSLISKYKDHVSAVLEEIRSKLELRNTDFSTKATSAIDRYLSDAIENTLFVGGDAESALRRAAQAGRLSPGAYRIVQPESFRQRFYALGITKDQIEKAIHQPSDYQHLLTDGSLEDEEDVFSLFMKRSDGRRGQSPNWVLVQCFRRGIEQIAQSAWRIYPSDVNLDGAEQPVDVLAAFANTFGTEVTIGGTTSKFIESIKLQKSPLTNEMVVKYQFEAKRPDEYFASVSNKKDKNPSVFSVGLVYCIDLTRYRASLRSHGASV